MVEVGGFEVRGRGDMVWGGFLCRIFLVLVLDFEIVFYFLSCF